MIKKSSKKERKIEKEILVVFAVVAGLIIIFFIGSIYFKSLSHFEYGNLKFTKEIYGKLPVYHYY